MKPTSIEAYHKNKHKFPSQKERIFFYIQSNGPKTRNEISAGTGFAIPAVCGRVNSLLNEKPPRIKELPKRACNVTGSNAAPLKVYNPEVEQTKLW